MQLYGRKKKRMVQAWMIDTSEEDQRTPHHRNPPQYISLEDLQKLGVLFYKLLLSSV
jgi:1,2-dihydroxy-3-keto-5-methylthiopentene dioxygenase